jgi:hypothetical protein
MRQQLSTAGFLIALIAVVSCSSATSSDPEGVRVEARQNVMLSDNMNRPGFRGDSVTWIQPR